MPLSTRWYGIWYNEGPESNSRHIPSLAHLTVVAGCADVGAAVRGPGQGVDRGLVALQLRYGKCGVPEVEDNHMDHVA